jgi:hypothetical protein
MLKRRNSHRKLVWSGQVNAKNTDKEVGIKLRCILGRQVVRWSGR